MHSTTASKPPLMITISSSSIAMPESRVAQCDEPAQLRIARRQTSNDAGRFKSAYRPGGRAIKIVIREKFGIEDAEPEWYEMRATHCLDEFGDQVADGNRCGTRWRGNRGGLAHSPRRDTAHVVA